MSIDLDELIPDVQDFWGESDEPTPTKPLDGCPIPAIGTASMGKGDTGDINEDDANWRWRAD